MTLRIDNPKVKESLASIATGGIKSNTAATANVFQLWSLGGGGKG